MSSNNNDNSGMAAGFGLVVAVLGTIALTVFAVVFFALLFVTFVLTMLCLVAWNRPVTIARWTLMPEDARSFVRRGLAGAVLLPAFLIFLEQAFGVFISGEYLMHVIIGGYMLGSLGLEILW